MRYFVLLFLVTAAMVDAQLFPQSKVGKDGYHYPKPAIKFEETTTKSPVTRTTTKPTTRKPITEKVKPTPPPEKDLEKICKEAREKGLLNKKGSGFGKSTHVKGSFIRNRPGRPIFYTPPKKTKLSSGRKAIGKPGQEIDYNLIC